MYLAIADAYLDKIMSYDQWLNSRLESKMPQQITI